MSVLGFSIGSYYNYNYYTTHCTGTHVLYVEGYTGSLRLDLSKSTHSLGLKHCMASCFNISQHFYIISAPAFGSCGVGQLMVRKIRRASMFNFSIWHADSET